MRVTPSVSIVLPVWNGASDLRELLPAIFAQEYEGQVEIVAIDSGSGDESAALLREAGARLWQISQSEFGHGKTRNFGVRQSEGEVVVFLSQDALPVGTHWLRELVLPLSDTSVGAVYARQLPRANATPIERAFHAQLYPPVSRTTSPRQSARTPFFSNVCSAARRETALRFPFDESLVMSEDQLFARDLLGAGLSLVYVAHAEVIHSHVYDLPTLFRRNFDSGYSMNEIDTTGVNHKIRRVARFLGSEVRFLAREREWKALSRMPLYEGTRLSALFLGGQGHRFPLSWRRKLSQHRAFWKDA